MYINQEWDEQKSKLYNSSFNKGLDNLKVLLTLLFSVACRQTAKEFFEWRGIGIPDRIAENKPEPQKRAFVKIRWDGGAYYFTGVLLAHAAMSLLKDETEAKKFGGGLLTPATLGEPFVERLVAAGLRFETSMVDD